MRTHALLAVLPLVVTARAAAQATTGPADRFASPNGQLGAGISFSGEQKGRAYAELTFGRMAASDDVNGLSFKEHVNSLTLLLGGAYRVLPQVEIEAMLPLGWAQVGASTSFQGQTESSSRAGLALANLHLGASWLRAGHPWRLKVGGAIEYGPWTHNYGAPAEVAVAAGHPSYGGENIGLWAPDVFSLVAPARFEYGERLVGSADALIGLHIPTHGGNTELTYQLGLGVGYYALDQLLIGIRFPFTWMPTESGSASTFFAAQPYGRYDIGNAFLDASLMLNIDEPYGFAFDSGKWWALHFGGGGSF
jgi:hypothetical protein